MARTSDVNPRDIVSSSFWNTHFDDYLSQTDTNLQTIASDLSKGTTKAGRTLTPTTLGVGVTTFAVTGEAMVITGDGGGNTVVTITGGRTGQLLFLIFTNTVTVADTDAHTADTVDLVGTATNLVAADDTTLTLIFDGTSWYELSRSVN